MGIVTLVSGGLDSTLMSLMAKDEGLELFPLFIDYGQLAAEKEWQACKNVHEKYGLPSVTKMDLSGFGRVIPSGITDRRLRINEDAFLPGRNLLLLVAGAAYAFKMQVESVAIGLLNPECHLFPDQTKEFIQAAEAVIETAIGKHIRIITPLIEMSKSDVLAMAEARGLCGTYSCHSGDDVPCGVCVSCVEVINTRRRN